MVNVQMVDMKLETGNGEVQSCSDIPSIEISSNSTKPEKWNIVCCEAKLKVR